MSTFEVTVENVEQTLREMARYSADKEKEIDKVVKKYARAITERAKATAPVGPTSNLRNSIKPKYFRKLGPSATVFPRSRGGGYHRHLVEYGTKSRVQKTTGRKVGRMPAYPFMKFAQQSFMVQYLAEMKGIVDKVDTI